MNMQIHMSTDSNSSPESSADDEKLEHPKSSEGDGNLYPRVRFRGIRRRSWGQWVSEIREPRKRSKIWLGSFPTPQMAARAYDAALLCLRGPNAAFNFADSPSLIHPGAWTSKKDIQAIAAAAAGEITSTQQSVCTPTPVITANSEAPNQILDQISEDSNCIPNNNQNTDTFGELESGDTQTLDWLNAVRMEEDTTSLMTLPDMAKGMLLDPLPPLQLLYNERPHHLESEEVVDDDGGNSNSHEELPFWS